MTGYQSFDDFLGAMSSRKRKAIRRERRDAQAGLSFRALRGPGADAARCGSAFYEFYKSTVDRKWGSAYLTPPIFPHAGRSGSATAWC